MTSSIKFDIVNKLEPFKDLILHLRSNLTSKVKGHILEKLII